MIVRPYYLDILKTYRDVPLVKILAGIRRCGKSTILDMLKDNLLEIKDHYPKYVVTLDELAAGNINGVKIVHLVDFLLSKDY